MSLQLFSLEAGSRARKEREREARRPALAPRGTGVRGRRAQSPPSGQRSGKRRLRNRIVVRDSRHSLNDKLARLLFFLGAFRDASAGRITAVVPYLAYAIRLPSSVVERRNL